LAVVPEPVAGTYKGLAVRIGLTARNVAEDLQVGAGDLGAAQPLFGLALALEAASVGDKLLLVGFGSGCDALVLEVTTAPPGGTAARTSLATGAALGDYVRFLSLTGSPRSRLGPAGGRQSRRSRRRVLASRVTAAT